MNALLDTNVIIHRENTRMTNQSIGQLFYWLDKLRYEKLIHPYTIKELMKYRDANMQELYSVKLDSYTQMRTVAPQTQEFIAALQSAPKTANDEIDNQLLYEVFSNRADILITEDRKMRDKAILLGIADRVFSINAFVSKATAENPALLNYRALSVRKTYCGNVDVNNVFFDSFRDSYTGFDKWFASKSNEEAYICHNDNDDILGFLYLKTEDTSENYSDITPAFTPKRRLKVGTFKVESTGFRLGERFIKIIFDNAIERKVEEIYVTLFVDRGELTALAELFRRWGFIRYGIKTTNGKKEVVLVKKMGQYDVDLSTKENFPNLNKLKQKFIMPIYPQYHTTLLPDSQLKTENEVDFLGKLPHRYALQKVYISWAPDRSAAPGDFLVFYRTGDTWPKKYSSVITTIGVIDEIVRGFKSENEFFGYCQNRSVFTDADLKKFWAQHRSDLMVIKFIYVKSLTKRLTLEYLWDKGVVEAPNGPRPFTKITDKQFSDILVDSQTIINM
jgi:predicted nucleic acid-binding protein